MRKAVLDKNSNCTGQDTDSIKIGVLHLTQVSNLTLSTGVRSHRMPEAEACGWKPCACNSAFDCQPLVILVIAFSNCRLGLWRDPKTNFLFDLAWVQVPRGDRQLWLSTVKLNLPHSFHYLWKLHCYIIFYCDEVCFHTLPRFSLPKPNQTTTPPKHKNYKRFSSKEGSSMSYGTGVLISSAFNELCSTLLRKIPFIILKFCSHISTEFSGEQFLNCN